MLSIEGKRVYLACGKTDMRKNINGLAAIVASSFKLDPFDGALFVLTSAKVIHIFSNIKALRKTQGTTSYFFDAVPCSSVFFGRFIIRAATISFPVLSDHP